MCTRFRLRLGEKSVLWNIPASFRTGDHMLRDLVVKDST